MESDTSNFNAPQKGVIKVLHESLGEVERHHTTLERKLQYNMAFISSIAALELALHLYLLEQGCLPPPMESAALMFMITYLGVAIIFVCAIWPQSRGSLPFEPTWPNVKLWWKYDIITFRNYLLSGYVKIWNQNQNLLDNKVMWTRLSYVLVAFALFIVSIQAALYWQHYVILPPVESIAGC